MVAFFGWVVLRVVYSAIGKAMMPVAIARRVSVTFMVSEEGL